MKKIWMILRKEWREMVQQRPLIISTLLVPLLFTFIAISGISPSGAGNLRGLQASALANPAVTGLTAAEANQAAGGEVSRLLFLLLPIVIPGVLAAYSIVGEKTNRTLEPLLATPVRVSELLLAKSLAALVPAVAVTWLAAGAFTIALVAQAPVAASHRGSDYARLVDRAAAGCAAHGPDQHRRDGDDLITRQRSAHRADGDHAGDAADFPGDPLTALRRPGLEPAHRPGRGRGAGRHRRRGAVGGDQALSARSDFDAVDVICNSNHENRHLELSVRIPQENGPHCQLRTGHRRDSRM